VLLQNVAQIRLYTCVSAMNRSLYRTGMLEKRSGGILGGFDETNGILHLASFKDKHSSFVLDTERGVVPRSMTGTPICTSAGEELEAEHSDR
jgi:hypothetical protein